MEGFQRPENLPIAAAPGSARVFNPANAYDHRIARLSDQSLKTIAIRKLNGDTVEEIGAFLGTSTRTIDRKLRLIRAIWEEAAG
jgi:hypothetical protein